MVDLAGPQYEYDSSARQIQFQDFDDMELIRFTETGVPTGTLTGVIGNWQRATGLTVAVVAGVDETHFSYYNTAGGGREI